MTSGALTNEPERSQHQLLRYFEWQHLGSENLRKVSRQFKDMATYIDWVLPNGSEKTVALRKLLEAKDAAVRSALDLDTPVDDISFGG